MSLLSRFLKAIKGDNFRIADNPPKYVDEMLTMNAEANSATAANSAKSVITQQKKVSRSSTKLSATRG